MRKDWERNELKFLSHSNRFADSITERMYGNSYLDSPFSQISAEEEGTYLLENIEHKLGTTLIDDHSEYIQDGLYERITINTSSANVISEEYEREFFAWMERGYRLWNIYPSANQDSPIVKVWQEEIVRLRQEFKEKIKNKLPF